MGLFKKNRFVWNEPWFFQQRIRDWKGWLFLSLTLFAIGWAVAIVLILCTPPGQPVAIFQTIAMSIGAMAVVWWAFDGSNTRRQAVLSQDELIVGGDMGKYSFPTTYKLARIPGAAIVQPEESLWPGPAIFFLYDGQEQAIGIDKRVSLPRLARAIHDAGVPVRLDGWDPESDDSYVQAFQWHASEGDVRATAEIETLAADQPGLVSVPAIMAALFLQLWPILLWLALIVPIIYLAYQNWNVMGLVQMVVSIVVGLGSFLVAAQVTERFATASTSAHLVKAAKRNVRKRDDVLIDVENGTLFEVQVRTPDQFDKVVHKIRETGFMQADIRASQLNFEGKKERWKIPFDAIESVKLEEIQMGTPGQSATAALLYFVVITFACKSGVIETLGLQDDSRDYGEHNDLKRAENGVRLFEAIVDGLPQSQEAEDLLEVCQS